MDYDPDINTIINKLIQSAYSINDWKIMKSTPDIVIDKKVVSDSPIKIIRGTIEINKPINCVSEYIQRVYNNINKIDTNLKLTLLEKIDEHSSIVLLEYRSLFPVNPRYFIVLMTTKYIGKNLIIHATSSIDYDYEQPDANYIKGNIDISGFICKTMGENQTKLTYLNQVDPKGKIPIMFVEKSMLQDVMEVSKIKAAIEK